MVSESSAVVGSSWDLSLPDHASGTLLRVPESVIDSGRPSQRLRWRTNFSPGGLAFSSSERLREVYVQAASVESATVVMD